MRSLVMLAVLLAGPALAEDWRKLDEAGITAALTSRVLGYPDGARQDFRPDGGTLYDDQKGSWAVRDDRYCSVWPPSDRWACYDVAARGLEIRFTSDSGEETIGTYVDLN